jgi:acyl carrier protein
MEFEQKFGIEISDEDAGNNIITVGDAISFIEQNVK